MKKAIIALIFVAAAGLFATSGAFAQTPLNSGDGPLSLALVAETGFVKVLSHAIQIGEGGSRFDYVNEGGQELIFPINRFSAELGIGRRHTVVLLYQPLELATQSRFDRDVVVDDVTFTAGQAVDLTYSFPFYRLSYLYDFSPLPRLELAAGASLQLRNASIRFASIDGGDGDLAISQNLGPVPIVKVRAEYHPDGRIPGAFVAFEADGFYASSAFINGSAFEFTGSIYDASLRAGFSPANGVDVFVNARGLGGGGTGTRGRDRAVWSESREPYTDNFLNTLSLTLGARLR